MSKVNNINMINNALQKCSSIQNLKFMKIYIVTLTGLQEIVWPYYAQYMK